MSKGHPKAKEVKVRTNPSELLPGTRLRANITGNLPGWRLWFQRIFEAMSRRNAPRYSDNPAS